jgi:hypothetical protein
LLPNLIIPRFFGRRVAGTFPLIPTPLIPNVQYRYSCYIIGINIDYWIVIGIQRLLF